MLALKDQIFLSYVVKKGLKNSPRHSSQNNHFCAHFSYNRCTVFYQLSNLAYTLHMQIKNILIFSHKRESINDSKEYFQLFNFRSKWPLNLTILLIQEFLDSSNDEGSDSGENSVDLGPELSLEHHPLHRLDQVAIDLSSKIKILRSNYVNRN